MRRPIKPTARLGWILILIAFSWTSLRLFQGGVPRLKMPASPQGEPRPVSSGGLLNGFAWLAAGGSLWHVGKDDLGIFGTNDSCSRIPRRLGEIHDWKTMAASGDQWIGIRQDGSVWGWNASVRGHAGSVQLPRLSPQRLVQGTNWVQSISSGAGAFYLLSADGSLWAAGDNREGALGDGTTLPRFNFVAVTTAHRWRAMAAGAWSAAAIATNGTLWIWGREAQPLPTQVGTASNWVQVLGHDYLFTAQNSEGDWTVWGANAQSIIPGAPDFPREPLKFLPNSRRWSLVIPTGLSMVARSHDGHYERWGVGFPDTATMNPGNPEGHLPFQLPKGVREIYPIHDSPGRILAWSPDGTLWVWGEIPGTDGQTTPGERFRQWITATLKHVGIDRPGLRQWSEPRTFTTNFLPIARFVGP